MLRCVVRRFNDANFNQGSDEITYRIPVAVAGELNVSVSLNYQTITYSFLQDLYRDNHLEQVQTFKTLYDAQSLKHEQIASVQTTVTNAASSVLDSDSDGLIDSKDNCILVANPAQRDTDTDGYGNYCDPDFDNNLMVNASDLSYLKSTFFTADPDADLDGSGSVSAGDLAILKSFYFELPGPSGLQP